ncbi:Ku protein [Enterovirga rhinocerotis]|uniref:Non-homologous end joining protein Ku n=1 Tax=Enterovirga rhinocerotis TaxID=1339210 RepID=A0A4R7C9H9_9HYPH|nr:Ku protein [Enterovirga rhinocerotis]TDR94702.1 DNA end-binding protein Ku [Enterovirga rhinocerotis]
MAARANWKGYLKLSLVSCPVQLFPATTSRERVSFHLLNRETGNRLRRRLVDPETEAEVEADEQVRGYAVGKNEYILMEEGDFDSVAIESNHTIDIETFVARDEIDETFLDTPYYLAPDGAMAEEAFSVIREAMREKGVCGIGRVVLYRRERPILLEPRGKGLVATTLRYAYEVRADEEVFEDIADKDVPDEMLDLATHIIGRKMAHFDPKQFEDRYQDALLAIIDAKRHNRPVKSAPAAKKTGNVVSLMDALRKSLADQGKGEAKTSPAKAKASGKAEEGGGKAAPKSPARKKPASTSRRTAARSSGRMRKAS